VVEIDWDNMNFTVIEETQPDLESSGI
jgi:hypothetical protein